MDPISIIGLAGSIVNIVDVISKSIQNLYDLQQRWKAADLTVQSLIGQLSTLKSALSHIHEWLSSSLSKEPQLDQTVIDLRQSLDSCHHLMTFMYDHLVLLDWTEANRMTSASKIRAVFHGNEMKDCAIYLDRQANALNLLLTALNCRSSSQQHSILRAPESRQLLDQVKDDSSSLLGLRSRSSFQSSRTASTFTQSSALISLVFDFDEEILDTNPYQRQLKSCFRRNLARRDLHPKRKLFRAKEQHELISELEVEQYLKYIRPRRSNLWADDGDCWPRLSIPYFDDFGNDFGMVMKKLKSYSKYYRYRADFSDSTRARLKYIIYSYLIITIQLGLEVVGLIGMIHPSPEFEDCANTFLLLKRGFIWSSEIARSVKMLSNVLSKEHIDGVMLYDIAWKIFPYWAKESFWSARYIADPAYTPYYSDLIHAMEIAEITLREDEFIYEGKIIRLISDEGLREAFTLTTPFPIVIFRINMSSRAANKQANKQLQDPSDCKSRPLRFESCEESLRHYDYYSKHISIASDFMSRHRPELTGFIINTATLPELSDDSRYICNCAHKFISHVRQIVRGSSVFLHYTPLTKETCHQSNVVRDFVNFISEILDDALDRDVIKRPSKNGIGKLASNQAADSSLLRALSAEFPVLGADSPVLKLDFPIRKVESTSPTAQFTKKRSQSPIRDRPLPITDSSSCNAPFNHENHEEPASIDPSSDNSSNDQNNPPTTMVQRRILHETTIQPPKPRRRHTPMPDWLATRRRVKYITNQYYNTAPRNGVGNAN